MRACDVDVSIFDCELCYLVHLTEACLLVHSRGKRSLCKLYDRLVTVEMDGNCMSAFRVVASKIYRPVFIG